MTRKFGNQKRTTCPRKMIVIFFHYNLSKFASISRFPWHRAEMSLSFNFRSTLSFATF